MQRSPLTAPVHTGHMVEAPKDAEKLLDIELGRKLEAHDDLARLVRFAHGLHPSHN